jgi:NAD(P)-dependent dehydrogenase (short-subunit alcohol dehydrogenase family)
MKVLITGADGFIGKNLRLHLAERKADQVVCFTRQHPWPSCSSCCWGWTLCFTWRASTARKTQQSLPPAMRDLTVACARPWLPWRKPGQVGAGGVCIVHPGRA